MRAGAMPPRVSSGNRGQFHRVSPVELRSVDALLGSGLHLRRMPYTSCAEVATALRSNRLAPRRGGKCPVYEGATGLGAATPEDHPASRRTLLVFGVVAIALLAGPPRLAEPQSSTNKV